MKKHDTDGKSSAFRTALLMATLTAAPFGLAHIAQAQVANPPRPAAPLSAAAKAELAKKAADQLTREGIDAAALGDFKAARDNFLDATNLDRTNRRAQEGLGYSFLKLADVKRATTALESAYAIGNAGAAGRSLSVNLAFSLLRVRNPMRAAKVLKDYMSQSPDKVDEEVLNALAICLSQAGDEARVNKLWKDCVAFYEQQNTKLEATRSGVRRWGIEWIPTHEYDRKSSRNAAVQSRLDAKNNELRNARAALSNAEARYNQARVGSRFRRGPAVNLGPLQADVQQQQARVNQLSSESDAIYKELERPKFPNLFEPVALDEWAPPEMAIAKADAPAISPGSSGSLTTRPPLTTPPSTTPPATTPPSTTPPATMPPDRTPPATEPPVAARPPTTTPPPTTTNPPVSRPPTTVEPPVAVAPSPRPAQRTVTRRSAAFAVGPDLLVTSAEGVANMTQITVRPANANSCPGEVVKVDEASGLALIRVKGTRLNFLPIADAFAGGAIKCACFPTSNIFEAATATLSGTAPPPKDDGWQISLGSHPRLAGAPLLSNGKVVGVMLGNRDHESTMLPAASLAELRKLLGAPSAVGINDAELAIAEITASR